ncbi:DivIVA domain-containing protein [Latilactobacillus fuchuensis]|uniref:Septum site-determining divIVA domain protein n=2 Tax=Latilactobacillus fuchuensis TaxID=164393 RepID=A0A2N9DUV1_9LACO|nr:DivIVA domain-containing protein [Latilactobacillus fuchuensis]KRL61432.1 septum site-determining divIVA domain protein [Latilactobacillus fuchuensis DSM 14340 = JCM 11249]MCP8857601.1 DivIVA domain-containing protein [Latilactobacillus fuchuensis]SPC37969.1 Septum site-determining divIVA domain protein [Latilactobacillus fuchuensis]
MVLTPLDIHNKEFNNKMRGYNPDQVNDFLDQVIKDYETVLKENDALKADLKSSDEKVTYFNELKDALNQSIIVAQEAADKVKENAKRESEIIQTESEKNAKSMLDDATEKSNHIIEDATERAKRIAIETDDLKKQTRIFKQRLQVMLESQLEVVKSPEWTDLLAKDELADHQTLSEEIDITELDNKGDNQVNSTTEAVKPWGEIAEDQVETTQTIVFPDDDSMSDSEETEDAEVTTDQAYDPIESSTDQVDNDENKN